MDRDFYEFILDYCKSTTHNIKTEEELEQNFPKLDYLVTLYNEIENKTELKDTLMKNTVANLFVEKLTEGKMGKLNEYH